VQFDGDRTIKGPASRTPTAGIKPSQTSHLFLMHSFVCHTGGAGVGCSRGSCTKEEVVQVRADEDSTVRNFT